MAVIPGVKGSAVAVSGESGRVGLVALLHESCVTGRMVAPLKSGELDADLGERGVRGLSPSELWPFGVSGEETLSFFDSVLNELRSRLGTVELRFGMLDDWETRQRVYEGSGIKVRWDLDPVASDGIICRPGSKSRSSRPSRLRLRCV